MTAMAMSEELFDDEARVPVSRLSHFLLGSAALLAIAGAIWGFFHVTGTESVARLQVEGRMLRVDAAQVDAVVRPLLDARFVEVDLHAIQDAVSALPWVARARVERAWPATVRVRVWEREPAARWGEQTLLDSDATLFAPDGREIPDGLPLLSGPEGSAAMVLGVHRQIARRLDGTPFALAGLRRDARGDWTATTIGGIELRFGRNDPLTTLDMLLGPGARALAAQLEEVAHIDLRYTNGFSVGWREPDASSRRK
jgi:cell division protein FtsQ